MLSHIAEAQFGPQQVITSSANSASSVFAADVDGDGDMDVLSASALDNTFAWYANDGYGGFGAQIVITNSAQLPQSICAADLDNDGDIDVAAACAGATGQVSWFENVGGGNFGGQQTISSGSGSAVFVFTIDLTGDLAKDILVSYYDRISWFENDGIGGFGPEQVISTSVNQARSVFAIDLDGDGDADVLSASSDDNKVAWYENDGTGVFATQVVISNSVPQAWSVFSIDLDADGDNDVVLGSNGKITWYENNGFGSFGPEQIITTQVDGAGFIFCADLDGDNDADVISASLGDDKVAWYENDGAGNFGLQTVITTSTDWAYSVYAADLDGDGDRDVLSASLQDDKVAWYENFINSAFQIHGTVFYDADLNGAHDISEIGFPWVTVVTDPMAAVPITDVLGEYTVYSDSGLFDVFALLPSALWSWTTDSSYTVQLTGLSPTSWGNDFGVVPAIDTSIVLPSLAQGPAPCLGETSLWVSYANQGTRIEHGLVSLEIDPHYSLLNAVPIPDSIIGATLWWAFDSLSYFQLRSIEMVVETPSSAFIGALTEHILTVFTLDSAGNSTGIFNASLSEELACSFDPNDKRVYPPGYGQYGALALSYDHLDFTIRFQNTGTAPAINVMLRDRLSTNLDRTRLQILGYSHNPDQVQIEQDGELVIRFNNINLPDSGMSFTESQGFIAFRIGLHDSLPNSTEIENAADIYFDYNAPVVTNTTLNTLVDCALWDPQITLAAVDLLEALQGDFYQWFLDGSPLSGETSQTLFITSPGDYTVEVTSIYGCVDLSDPYQIIATNLPEEPGAEVTIVPNPFSAVARLICSEILTSDHRIQFIDLHGRIVRILQGNGNRELLLTREGLTEGLYVVRIDREEELVRAIRVVVQ